METLSNLVASVSDSKDYTDWLLDTVEYQDELLSIQASEELALADLLLEQEEK